jgi:hypothetical protein
MDSTSGVQLTSSENIAAAVAPGGKLGVVAGAAVDPVRLAAKLLVHKARATLTEDEGK